MGAAPIRARSIDDADQHDAEDAGHPEAGEQEHLHAERDQADAEQQDFLPARESEQKLRSEEEPEGRQAEQSAQPERAGLDLEDEAEHAEREQER